MITDFSNLFFGMTNFVTNYFNEKVYNTAQRQYLNSLKIAKEKTYKPKLKV